MYVYVFIYVCACVCICMCGCIDIRVCMCVHVESICAGMCAYRFIHVSHRRARVWTCAHACIYTHAFIHIYMYIDTHGVWTCVYVCAGVCVSGKCFSYFHLGTNYLEILLKCRFRFRTSGVGEAWDSVSSKIWGGAAATGLTPAVWVKEGTIQRGLRTWPPNTMHGPSLVLPSEKQTHKTTKDTL